MACHTSRRPDARASSLHRRNVSTAGTGEERTAEEGQLGGDSLSRTLGTLCLPTFPPLTAPTRRRLPAREPRDARVRRGANSWRGSAPVPPTDDRTAREF